MTSRGALDLLYLDHVEELRRRYAVTLEREGWDAVVIHSGSPVKRSAFDDQYWPLRPVPHWQHWSSLAEPDCAIVVRPDRRPRLLRQAARSFWEKAPPPDSDAFHDAFDVTGVGTDAKSAADAKALAGGGRVAFVGDGSAAQAWGLDRDDVNPAALLRALDGLRVTKTPFEVSCIAEANARARAGHEALRDAFRDGDVSELDLHLEYLRATRQDDWETPYKNIVALGPNAATLHHVAYGKLGPGKRPGARDAESLLVDAGATCRGYCADVTRTWVKGRGAAASAFEQLLAGVEAMQQALCAAVRVDSRYEALHDEAHRRVAGVLRDVGIVVASADEAVALGVTRAFFPHGLGHSLGLQTHDVGCATREPRADNPFLRNTTDIAVGQVFTIEPGVYFIDDLLAPLRSGPHAATVDWRLVDALAPLGGVRVEDDLHVTGGPTAARNLTREHLAVGAARVAG